MKKIVFLCTVWLLCVGDLYAASGDLLVNGNLGIGTTTPASKISVGGSCESSSGICVRGDSTNGITTGVSVSGANYGIMVSGKDIGVMGNGPQFGVWGLSYGSGGKGVAGHGPAGGYDFYATGSGLDFGSYSSSRWKKNIAPIGNALEKVKALRGVSYDLDKEHGNKHDIGFIGEEVAKVLPEITAADPEAPGYVSGMDYSRMTPLLLEAIKEQQAQIEALQAEIKELKKK